MWQKQSSLFGRSACDEEKKICDIGTWKRKTSAFYLLASDQQKKRERKLKEKMSEKNKIRH